MKIHNAKVRFKRPLKKYLNTILNSTKPNNQLLSNLDLYLNSKNLFSIIFLIKYIKKIIKIPGVIIEFEHDRKKINFFL